MKIVIDIDNETYGRIQALVNADYFEHDICGYSMQRIANGTPYEERPKGEWVGINEYIKHLEEETGDRYEVSSLYNGSIFCNQCWEMNKEKSRFCPTCGTKMRKGDPDCMDEDAKQASIPYIYNASQHDWKYLSKCGYPDITRGKEE